MPVPILCLDEDGRHVAERFREHLSKLPEQYLAIVLLGLMLCEEARTLSGLVEQIAQSPRLAGLRRFLSEAPWEEAAVGESWLRHVREEMHPQVAEEGQRERQMQPTRRGRPQIPVVTGYLIGDDSSMQKRKAKKMQEVGMPHSTSEDKRVRGQSLVERLSVGMTTRSPGSTPVSTASGVRRGRGAFCQHNHTDGNHDPHL
jgi:hypothetical protein